jgi:hypothetical protein
MNYQKLYYEKNKTKILENQKMYYQKYKKNILAKLKEKYDERKKAKNPQKYEQEFKKLAYLKKEASRRYQREYYYRRKYEKTNIKTLMSEPVKIYENVIIEL